MQVEFGDLLSTLADYFCTKQNKSVSTFLLSGIFSTIPRAEDLAFQCKFGVHSIHVQK